MQYYIGLLSFLEYSCNIFTFVVFVYIFGLYVAYIMNNLCCNRSYYFYLE